MKILVFGRLLLMLFVARIDAFSVHGPAEPLIVQPGDSVMLPCSVDTPLPLQELEVEWKRIDSETMVHLFQDGESRPESQDERYSGRAEFFVDEIPKGNFSLLLVNVSPEDRGKYKCVVYTNQESREAYADLAMEWLVVTGADEAVFVYAGEDVILNCSVDTHMPVEELEVKWIKTDQGIMVLLFDEGQNRPESQHERYSGRAEFFTEEIPKGNFSMKLRNVRTEDRGEFMCKELEVEWKKTDSETMVHLFQDGHSRPESQDKRYSRRAEYFADEIPKGNFSLLLVNVTPEDRGKYKCVVHTSQESREAYADLVMELEVEWIKTDQEILVLLFLERESRPESQHERYSGRAEFFTEEIPKGNFSMKLRNVF
ncbi:butyrophilin-like protein 2 [Megalops cyprinoides]|uniref:butyrophilin-like protein 2 n=1 Tax=Megalops cyprinoides TaxID=118141 RepID=UPI001863D629|nr:butyrophilin-like protein 2 [Megalops cyprinoides]